MTRRALVTGGASGIGAATVARLLERGDQVTVVDREPAAGVDTVVGDVGDETVMREAVRRAAGAEGRLDLLHLNAGRAGVGPLAAETSLDDVRDVVSANLLGPLTGLVAALPALRSARGAVVVTSSLAGLIGSPADPVYAATKHALVGLVRSCAPVLGADGVRVGAVCPSLVATPLVPGVDELSDQGLPVLGAAEVADAVLRLAADDRTGVVVALEHGSDPHEVPEPHLSVLQQG